MIVAAYHYWSLIAAAAAAAAAAADCFCCGGYDGGQQVPGELGSALRPEWRLPVDRIASKVQLAYDGINVVGCEETNPIVEEVVMIAKPTLRASSPPLRGAAPSVLCNIFGSASLEWLPYSAVFSSDILSSTATNAKYLACGAPPDYLRRPGMYGYDPICPRMRLVAVCSEQT